MRRSKPVLKLTDPCHKNHITEQLSELSTKQTERDTHRHQSVSTVIIIIIIIISSFI